MNPDQLETGFEEKGEDKLEHMFQAQEAEVSVEVEGKLSGGWIVAGEDLTQEKGTHVIVRKDQEMKSVPVEELAALQPFKVGETVPVLRNPIKGSKEKWLDSGWEITSAPGYGLFRVEKLIDGKLNHKNVRKIDLIEAQINRAEGENADKGENLKYWKEKLYGAREAERMHFKKMKESDAKQARKDQNQEEEEEELVGSTPRI